MLTHDWKGGQSFSCTREGWGQADENGTGGDWRKVGRRACVRGLPVGIGGMRRKRIRKQTGGREASKVSVRWNDLAPLLETEYGPGKKETWV